MDFCTHSATIYMLSVVNSVIRQQGCNSLRYLHKGIHSFLESPGDWSYWSMTLHVHVLTTVMSQDESVLLIGLELVHQQT